MTQATAQAQTINKSCMLTIPKLAAMNILPGRAIRRLVAEKKIPVIEVGNRKYINLAVFERYLAGEQGGEGESYDDDGTY